jgi:DinB superfamily
METSFSNISGIFKINTEVVNRAIADVKPDDWFRTPGDDSNHLMWLLGHLVVHRGHVLKTLGLEWESSWASLFARGAERVAAAEYPPVEEMTNAWLQISDQLRAALREPPADVLAKPSSEGAPSFDKKLSGTVAFYAFHDAYHAGQMSFLRKWLGYGQTVG